MTLKEQDRLCTGIIAAGGGLGALVGAGVFHPVVDLGLLVPFVAACGVVGAFFALIGMALYTAITGKYPGE